MKVERDRAARTNERHGHRRTLGRAGMKASRFVEALRQAQRLEEGRAVPGIDEVDAAAERLLNSPTLANLYEYRRAVARLVRALLNGAFQVVTTVGMVRAGRQKLYTLVRVIDRELEALTRMIIERERDRSRIAVKLDELRGLLLDFYR